MKKLLTAAATGSVLATALGMATAIAPADAAAPEGVQDIARDYLANHPGVARSTDADTYQVVDTIRSATGTAVRFTRTYEGLPVLGGDIAVQVRDGGVAGASVAQDKKIGVDTTPTVSQSAAADQARQAAGSAKVSSVGTPELVVDARSGAATLAYRTLVEGMQADGQTPSRQVVVTDARTGAVLSSQETILTPIAPEMRVNRTAPKQASAPALEAGTGQGIFVSDVPIDATPGSSGFDMIDPERGNGSTCDMGNGQSSCDTFTDDDNAWGDGTMGDRASAGVDAHYGAAQTWDYFADAHGRSGIFDDGAGVPSRVHYGSNYVNAFWDGSQMTYGDGENDENPLVALDVAGHEMSHGVTEATAGLEYSGDAGGLNEATSDIFGTMVEFHANNPSDAPDFLIGEQIDINGDGSPLRYMDEPSKDGASYDCWSDEVPQSDPHYSSGVGNHFFFLLANGSGASDFGDSPTCDGSTVTGIGNEAAAAIWFTALSQYMTSTETYAEAREHTVQAATDLYGAGSAEVTATEAAWTAVSVG